VPEVARGWLSFPVDDGAVRAIAARLNAWLAAPADVRERTREALVRTARDRYSWEGVASGVLRAARGDLQALPPVG
jgi:glycosyltransferase involved in cell wall biosynthesis